MAGNLWWTGSGLTHLSTRLTNFMCSLFTSGQLHLPYLDILLNVPFKVCLIINILSNTINRYNSIFGLNLNFLLPLCTNAFMSDHPASVINSTGFRLSHYQFKNVSILARHFLSFFFCILFEFVR